MPTYEYECKTCGIHFEKHQRFSDEPLQRCPECDGPVRRVPFPVGIVFKGSGFYCTDNRSSSSSSVAPKDKGETGKGEGKQEKREEAQPEKKDTKPSD